MKLLVLGGTRFLGRHAVALALERGHQVTLLHRGRTNGARGLFPEAEHRIADRNQGLAALAEGEWDAVLDTSAYVPRHLATATASLQGRVGRYLLVSTISVYAAFGSGPDEDAPLATLPDPTVEDVTGATYGGLKALCEAALHAALPGAALVARPGLIVGPHDPTGRFTWWLRRIAAGGEVLAPGSPQAAVQFIDARDLACWLLDQAEAGTTGTFNLTGPPEPLAMGTLLETARRVLNPEARLTWLDEPFLVQQGVAPWTELPLWLTTADAGLHATRIDRALATGLRCRPLEATIADTAAWDRAEALQTPGIGLDPAREAALLAAWHAR